MDKELKSDIKKILLADTLLTSSFSIARILDEVEEELEEIFGRPQENSFKIEDLFKIKTTK
jgi:hypothetical protein